MGGHLLREDEFIIEGKIKRKRRRERPRVAFSKLIK